MSAASIAARIKRVTRGLLPGYRLAGHSVAMKLQERMAHYKVPGVSIAVISYGRLEWASGFGLKEAGKPGRVTTKTLFQAASISKPVTAMAVLGWVEKGGPGLNADVNGCLQNWKVPENKFTRKEKVTLRRLLSHSAGLSTSGFPGYSARHPVPSLIQVLDGEKPANSPAVRVVAVPGSRWSYSGGGYSVLQQLLIEAHGRTFPELMQAAVLTPLGMAHSTFEQPLPRDRWPQAARSHRRSGRTLAGNWRTHPEMAAAGLWTTPSDVARFALEIQHSLAGKSRKTLSRAMTRQMLTEQIGSCGLGFLLKGSGKQLAFSHGGSNRGYKNQLFAYAHTGQGAVIMTNGDQGWELLVEILRSVAEEYGWHDYRPLPILDWLPSKLRAYAGAYRQKGGERARLRLRAEGSLLRIKMPGYFIELGPVADGKFNGLDNFQDCEYRFIVGKDGAVKGFREFWKTPKKFGKSYLRSR